MDIFRLDTIDFFSHPGTALAVLGHPVEHSLSPAMHNAALAALAERDPRFRSWRYFRFSVPAEQLPQALPRLLEKGLAGLNLTIPHKVQAVSLVHEISPQARLLGAVNTLVAQPTGWSGHNTDGYGIEKALAEELNVGWKNREVVLLGAGGAARAIAAQALQNGVAALWIGNRDQDRLAGLLALLQPLAGSIPLHPFSLHQIPPLPADALIINATSLGLHPDDPAPLPLAQFSSDAVVYDTTYGRHESQLCQKAKARGMRAANGLSMLVWQGARALELWTGLPVPTSVMRQAAETALAGPA